MRKNLVFTLLACFVFAVPAFSQPAVPAPTPTEPAGEVTSLFSNVYTNVTVDTWSAVWDMADVADVQIMGDDTKLYTNLVFAGIEFTSQVLDVSDHTHFHMDIWTPDPTIDPNVFRIKLVDFGPDGVWGGDDSEHELTFNEFSNPPLMTGQWVEFDIPLSDFAGLTNLTSMAQLIIQADPGPNTVYIDNIYFSGTGGGGGEDPVPTVAAPIPTEPANEVISLFSDAYTDVTVDTWSAPWDMANVEDYDISGDMTKLYTGFIFAGIEFTSQVIDVSDLLYFHLDYWTPDPINVGDVFKIKLVDFGVDGMWGGGDDSEHELVFDHNTLVSQDWVSFDILLSDFTNLTNLTSMAQLILVSDPGPNTVYIDNVYFHTLDTPPDPVEVTMDPVDAPVVVPQGGVFFFDIAVTNNTPNTGSGRLYTEAILPSGMTYGPVLDVTGLTIPGNHTFNFTGLGQSIPAGAPVGMYTYVCNVQYAGGTAVSSFDFEVVAGPVATNPGNWDVFGIEQFGKATDLEVAGNAVPTESAMVTAYPNPFNPTTTVQLTLPQAAEINVVVHNSLGQQVATLASGTMTAGTHALTLDGSNLASGLYFVQASVAGQPLGVQKLMLLK